MATVTQTENAREVPDFSGPGQHALTVILALAGGAPELAAQLRLEDYGRLADRFRRSPPRTQEELEAIYIEWLDADVGHRIAADAAAALGVLDLLPAKAGASSSADDALQHVLTRSPRKGRASPRNWIEKLNTGGSLRPWLAESVRLEARKRDLGRVAVDDDLLVGAAAAGEIERDAISESAILSAAAALAGQGFPERQGRAYAMAAAGRSDAEIGAALKIEAGAVRVLLHRARRRALAAGLPPLKDRRAEGRRRRA